jgi:glycosyltransferase involved in cell wall biosynthesis
VAQKHLTLLVDSWLESRRLGVDSRLLLVGDGPEHSVLAARLRDNAPPDRWHITGWTEEPGAYLSAMDVFAMTSHFEGMPLVLLEAAGRGVPALVTNFNGATDVADRAGWVSVASDTTPSGFGRALSTRLTDLANLKRQAVDGQSAFRAYFSPDRMAADVLSTLAVG